MCCGKITDCVNSDFFHPSRTRADRLFGASIANRWWEVKRLQVMHTIDHTVRSPETGKTLLLNAAEAGKINRMRAAIAQGANINEADFGGRNALMYGAMTGNVREIEILIDLGANLESQDNLGRTPLIHAALNGQNTALEALLQVGSNPYMRSKVKEAETVSSIIVSRTNAAGLKILLNHHVNLKLFQSDCLSEQYQKGLASRAIQDTLFDHFLELEKEIESATNLKPDVVPLVTSYIYPDLPQHRSDALFTIDLKGKKERTTKPKKTPRPERKTPLQEPSYVTVHVRSGLGPAHEVFPDEHF